MCNCGKVIAPKKNPNPKRPAFQNAITRRKLAKAAAKKRAVAARRSFPPKKK